MYQIYVTLRNILLITCFRSIPIYLQWLSYFSWFKYSNEALMINQWENVTDIQCPVANSTCLPNGHVVLETYAFSEVSKMCSLSTISLINISLSGTPFTGYNLVVLSHTGIQVDGVFCVVMENLSERVNNLRKQIFS